MHLLISCVQKIYRKLSDSNATFNNNLKEASNKLYKEKNPYLPYRTINNIIRANKIKPSFELFFFIPKIYKSYIQSLLIQLLINSNSHLLQQVIIHQFKPKIRQFFYLPYSILKFLSQKDYKINWFKSHQKIITISFANWKSAIHYAFQILVKQSQYKYNLNEKRCDIYSIPKNCLPVENSYTLLDWIENLSSLKDQFSHYNIIGSFEKNFDMKFKKNISFNKNIFPQLKSNKLKIIFFLQICFLSVFSLFFLLISKWQLAYLLKEIFLYKYYLLLENNQKADCLIYFNHNVGIRPLWTYEAENEGKKVINIFYASSYTLFHYNSEIVPPDIKHPMLQCASWTNYWVQSNEFKTTLISLIENPIHVEVVGPFPFTDIGEPIPQLNANELLIFDVDPSNNFFELSKHGYIIPYLTEEVLCQFWSDLTQIAKDLKLVLVHKRKRTDPLEQSTYTLLLKQIENENKIYKRISENLNTFKLLKQNPKTISISVPFTSTGELGTLLNLNAVYYDPFGGIQNPELHSRGTHCINTKESLKNYLLEILRKNNHE